LQGTNRLIGSDPAVHVTPGIKRLAVHGILTGSVPRRDEARVFDVRSWMHDSGSAMRHHTDEPQAGKNQQGHENQGNRIHDHAMSIVIEAFRAFVFREVWDW
jgi:hypothetical protein